MFSNCKGISRARTFRENENGSSTVEVAMWLPVFFLILIGSIEATLLLRAQTKLWSVASDTSRLVALHEMDLKAAKAYAESMAAEGDIYIATVLNHGQTVETRLERSFSDVVGISLLSSLGKSLSVSSTYRIEPEI